MMAAMAGFAIEDAFLKAAAAAVPVAQVLVMFGAGGALVFGLVAAARKERLFRREVWATAMRVRFVFEFSGRLFYVLALALTPLSSATVILQSAPIFVVLGAVLFFGERVGWRRWMAIIGGLIGVLIIVNPGAESFSLLSLLAVLGTIGFSGRDLASRAAPSVLTSNVLGFYGFLTIVVAGVVYRMWEGAPFLLPDIQVGLAMAGAVLAGVLAYMSLMTAMRTGDVSAVTPFRYSRLLFGVGLGVLAFGETLDSRTIVGTVVILLAGAVIMKRDKA